jgi:leucyl aminopeptidase
MWKEIKNTRYEICDLTADVRNKITGRILRQFDNGKGYKQIGLTENGNKKTYLIHRLVAKAFIENYSDELDVNHKNGIRHDNRLINLECVSRQANNDDRVFSHYYFNGINTINKIIDLHSTGLTPEEIYTKLRDIAKENVKQNKH